MPFLEKLKNFFAPKWEPLICRPMDIIDLFRHDVSIGAPLEDLTIEINGKPHHVGISSDYDNRRYFDTYFFLDDQCFRTLEGFAEKCAVDGVLFCELETVKILRENLDSGDPRNSVLLSQREIK